MKVTELSAADAGKVVRVSDGDRQAQGPLASVSFDWKPSFEDWGAGLEVRVAQLRIGDWQIEVSPEATVDFVPVVPSGHESASAREDIE